MHKSTLKIIHKVFAKWICGKREVTTRLFLPTLSNSYVMITWDLAAGLSRARYIAPDGREGGMCAKHYILVCYRSCYLVLWSRWPDHLWITRERCHQTEIHPFISLLECLYEQVGTELKHTMVYHPQTTISRPTRVLPTLLTKYSFDPCMVSEGRRTLHMQWKKTPGEHLMAVSKTRPENC